MGNKYPFLSLWQTDAASVLHEAMGYIKFLQDQIQVLCSPYLINYSLVISLYDFLFYVN